MARISWIIIVIALLGGRGAAALTTCDTCSEISQMCAKLDKSIHRLNLIKRANEDFIAELDAREESAKIKVRSNISIAQKRIAALSIDLKKNQASLEVPSCKKCVLKEKSRE